MEAAQTKAKKVADGIEQSRQAFGVLRPEIQVNTRCAVLPLTLALLVLCSCVSFGRISTPRLLES